jgi:tetratricopeptide (TPR) repeat protein
MVVLDNARDAAQVRPLLPGDPGCVVVVTSRQRMPGLVAHAAARQLVLDPLPDGPAIELLARILPRERVAGEPEAAAALAKVCGNLPLALCIAAANLAEQPEHSLADRVAQLASASRLAALRIDGDDGPAPQAMFDLSYATLDATQQRVFRRLGVVPGPHVTPGVAAVLADVAVRTAGSCLDRLADIHLVQRQGSDRFTLHDLLREYAALRATAEDGAGTGSTVDRLYRYYVEASHAAAQALYPQVLRLDIGPSAVGVDGAVPAFADQAAATAWLGTELPNLLAAAADAARRGHPAAWLIPDALRNYFWHRRNVIDWRATAHAAADAADAVGDDRARAAAQFSLGHLAICVRDHETSAAHYAEALEASRRAAWAEAEASVLGNLAAVHAEAGRLNTAAGMFEQALTLHRTTGSRYREAVTLGNLGLLRASLGELRQAADLIGQALDLHRAHGSTATEAIVRTNLADVQIDLGLLDEAGANAATALELARRVGRIDAEIMALLYLSAVHREQGDTAGALTRVEQAWPLLDSVGDPEIEAKVHTALAAARHSAGDIMQAIHHYDRAVRLTTDNRHGVIAVRALIGLAAAHRDLGDTPAARTYAEQAASIARAAGYRRLEDRARVYLPQRVR